MLNFDGLKILDEHIKFLQDKCSTGNLFLVGWCIRDILLDIEKNLTDVDFTMAWKPEYIYENIKKDDVHHFITEKFGTITLIPKENKEIKYELTPLRTENDYSDNRHPEMINWQNDILLDSNRRDFSINCIYYFSSDFPKNNLNKEFKKHKKIQDEEMFQKSLKDNWVVFYSDLNLLVVQDENYISKLFPDWKFDEIFATYLIDILHEDFWYIERSSEWKIRIIIDPHKWIQDILNRKIKCVGEPTKRFTEDALRIVRALRFVSVLNQKLKDNQWDKPKITLFDIDTDTWKATKDLANLVSNISKERIHDELMKVFTSGDPFAFVSLLDEIKLLEYIFPALYATKNIEQPVRYHPFDVYVHTLMSLYHLQKINSDYLVRFAMLYHDVWKVGQYAAYEKTLSRDEIREILAWPLNHRVSWPELAKEDFARLTFSKSEIKDICRYIFNHHVPWEILNANEENRVKKLRKLYSEAWFEKVNNLLDITIADRLGQYNPMQNSADITDVEWLRTMLKKLEKDEWQFTQKDLVVDGKKIMEHFKLQSGPKIWELLSCALNWVLVDISNRNKEKEILAYLKWFIKTRL